MILTVASNVIGKAILAQSPPCAAFCIPPFVAGFAVVTNSDGRSKRVDIPLIIAYGV